MKTLVIGGSHAALALAAELRKLSPEEEIIIVSADPELPYQRPPLSKAYMSQKVSFEQMVSEMVHADLEAANKEQLLQLHDHSSILHGD